MTSNDSDYQKRRKEMIRGLTPPDITTKCLKVCSQYLGGSWSAVNEEKLTVKRITGGFTNQLYFCGLPQNFITLSNEPKEVAVRFYGKKWFGIYSGNERLNDLIIDLLTSVHNLGPKLYAIFEGGIIEEYIEV
jgi:hypothetical protein